MNRILLILILLQPIYASAANKESGPRMRTVPIEGFTSDVVDIKYGRSVKLLFPWPLDEYVKELSHVIDLSDTSVFTYDYQPGQNFIRVSYSKAGDFNGEVTDLFFNSHGYHFSIALRSTSRGAEYHSLIEYKIGGKDKLEYLARERVKIRDSINQEYKHKYDKIGEIAESKSLLIVGKMAMSKESKSSVYQESIVKDSSDDDVTLFVDETIQYDHVFIIPFEIKNETNKAIHPKEVVYFQSEDDVNRSLIFASDVSKKIEANDTGRGYVVTNDSNYDSRINNNLTLSTEHGKMEVVW